jgi:hypothetical protein
VRSGFDWTAASWLFDWAFHVIQAGVEDPELVARISVIVDNNFG